MPSPDALRHLIDWHLLGDDVWWDRIEAALRHERDRAWTETARHRALGLIFFNNSIRTRTSMELAGVQLGAHVTTLNVGQGTWGLEWRKGVVMNEDAAEHVQEAVGVLARYYDALGVRVFAGFKDYEQDRSDAVLKAIVGASSVPVVNLESAFFHPCQALGDAATIMKRFDGQVAGRRFLLTWASHPRALPMAVPNSALLMAARLGLNVTVARPEGYALDSQIMDIARGYAAAHGTTLEETDDPDAAYDGAEVVYAKAWASPLVYRSPTQEAARRADHAAWRVTEARMARTDDGVFMHCLPVRRNVVVTDGVLDSPRAIHLDQAGFRLHAQKAILEHVWNLS